MSCIDYNLFKQYIESFDHKVEIDEQKENPLRYDVWSVTSEHVDNMIRTGKIDNIPQDNAGQHILRKLSNSLKRLNANDKKVKKFKNDISYDEHNIELSIALHELMESVKGESDKARNENIEISSITNQSALPVLPLARVAASIGRKIAFQKKHRFNSQNKTDATAADIELIYHNLGLNALRMLEAKGYVVFPEGDQKSIKDYITSADLKKDQVGTTEITTDMPTVALNETTLKIKPNSAEADYFLNRSDSDLTGTSLGAITEILRATRQITQPSEISFPDTSAKKSDEELAAHDVYKLDDTMEAARKRIYKNPTYVHESMHDFLKLLHEDSKESGDAPIQILRDLLDNKPGLINSLFGLKRSDDFSIDKKESVGGQNLSKTTPINDLAEYYDLLMDNGGNPAGLHMAMKAGRNGRLYYENSVLNPHASKHSRYMLTAGSYSVDSNSADFNYLVYGIKEAIGDKNLTHDQITGKTASKLDQALKIFAEYENAKTLKGKMTKLSHLPAIFPNTDFVTLITTLKAVQDVRNPVDGKITTQFMVSADATASGGTLTFLQALGTDENVTNFLQRIGLIKGKEQDLDDLYGLMTEAIENFVEGNVDTNQTAPDIGANIESIKAILEDTINLIFKGLGKDVRELSKDPTMTFVYGQGKKGAITTMARALSDRIIDNLGDQGVKQYLATILDDQAYAKRSTENLLKEKDLYPKIVKAIRAKGIPGQLFDLMNNTVNKQYLDTFKKRSKAVFKLLDTLPKNKVIKILPASAVIEGFKATKLSLDSLGIPLAKIFEVASKTRDGEQTVLTRKNRTQKTVMDVSTIHAIDAAQLYRTVEAVAKDMGIVTVHDDIRGSVQTVRAAEKEYINQTINIAQNYDIHEQIMEAMKVYSPGIEDTAAYKKVEAVLNQHLDNKRTQIAEFNHETDALIGDGNKYAEFSAGKSQNSGKSEEKTKKTTNEQGTPENALERLRERSEVIDTYLKSTNRGKLDVGEENTYIPKQDRVVVSSLDNRQNQNRTLDYNDEKDFQDQIELIEHEILHSYTVPFLHDQLSKPENQRNKELRYIQKAFHQLLNDPMLLNKLSEKAGNRISHTRRNSTDWSNDVESLSEFISVMRAEPDVAKEVYAVLGKPHAGLKAAIDKLFEYIKRAFLQVTDQDLANDDIDIELLHDSITTVINSGKSMKENDYNLVQDILSEYVNVSFNAGKTKKDNRKGHPSNYVNYLNAAVARMISSKLERETTRISKNAHDILYQKFPLYSDAVDKLNGVYDRSESLQQVIHTITGGNIDKSKKAKILSKFAEIASDRNDVISHQLNNFHQETKNLNKEEMADMYNFVSHMNLHDYFILAGNLTTGKQIDREVEKLEKQIKKIKPRAITEVDALIRLNMTGEVIGDAYNLEANYTLDSDLGQDLRKYMALKSIQNIGTDKFENFLSKPNLVNLVKDHSVANRLSLLKNSGIAQLKDSLVPEYYKEPFHIKAVEKKDFGRYEYGETNGWKVLEIPGKNNLGIVYKPIIDSTYLAGAFTDVKLNSTDIIVNENQARYPNVVKTSNGNKLVLTLEQKRKLGLIEDFSQSLVRGTAHNMAIQDSQIIRDELLKKETRLILDKNKIDDLEIAIKAENIDHPWFIKLDGLEYQKLNPEIRAKYMPVGKKASNVKGFNNEVDLVRKDISHWLLGGSASSLSQNPHIKWVLRIVKDLIAGAKIGMVVLNPTKIARDNVSNLSYLAAMGLSPQFIAKEYNSIAGDFKEYMELRESINQLKVRLAANPDSPKLKKQIKSLQGRLKRNKLGDLNDKGFVNSLGSDLVSRNADTLSGFQADAHKALEYLFKNDKGNKNLLSHFIIQLQKVGFQSEDFVRYLGSIVGKAKAGSFFEKELNKAVDQIKEIKSEEDVINYVSQFTTSPGSEAVRFGSHMTDLTDVLAKETLYRYFVQEEQMSPENAKIKVLDSFPDYKENMPLAVKQLSDMGIIMFPSFWLRIQKVIYRLGRDKPLNLASELMLEEFVGSNIDNIVDANIINKSNTFGGLIHTPLEPIGVGSLIPTHIF